MLYKLLLASFVNISTTGGLPEANVGSLSAWLAENVLGVLSVVLTVVIIWIYLSQKNIEEEQFKPHVRVDRVRAKSSIPEAFELELSNIGKGAAQGLSLSLRPCLHPEDFTETDKEAIKDVTKVGTGANFTVFTQESEEVSAEVVYERLTPTTADVEQWIPASRTKLLPESDQVRFQATARANVVGDDRSTLFTEAVKNLPGEFTAMRLRLEVEYDVAYEPASLSVLPDKLYRTKQILAAHIPGLSPVETRSSEVALDYIVPAVATDSLAELVEHGASWHRFREQPNDIADDLRDAQMKLSN